MISKEDAEEIVKVYKHHQECGDYIVDEYVQSEDGRYLPLVHPSSLDNERVYIEDGWLFFNEYKVLIGKEDAGWSHKKNGDTEMPNFGEVLVLTLGKQNGQVMKYIYDLDTDKTEWVDKFYANLWNGFTSAIQFISSEEYFKIVKK